MRFVPVKSADQQAVLMLHRTRALLIRQLTMLANAFRAHLAEFGIVCETSNPTKRVINEPPILRITGRSLPDRDTIGRSSADRDYRMSTYDSAAIPGQSWGMSLNVDFVPHGFLICEA
jgi:hypothetical protein